MKAIFLITLLCGSTGVASDVPTAEEIVTLQDYAPCGMVSLYLVAQMRDVPVEWEKVVETIGPVKTDRTHSFEDLSRAARQFGMHPVGIHARRESLRDLPMPAIVQVQDANNPEEPPHLLVLVKSSADGVWLLDAPFPAYFLPDSQFLKTWTGKTLVFAQDAAEAERLQSPSVSYSLRGVALWSWVSLGGVLLAALAGWQWVQRRRRAGEPVFPVRQVLRLRRRSIAFGAVAALGLVLGFTIIAGRLNARAELPPRCVFEEPVIDLGQIAPGDTSVPVTIRNDGDAALVITSVHSTCSCAVVKAPEVIEPRQSAVMQIELAVSPGPRGARITVESNDPAGSKHVALSWQGAAEPRLLPAGISESSAPLGKLYQRTLRLVYPGGKNALQPKLEKFECGSARVTVREGKSDPMAARFANSGLLSNVQGELEIHVTVEPADTPDTLQTFGTFALKYGNQNVSIPVPIDVRFTNPTIIPEVDAVSFFAGNLADLRGRERLVRFACTDADGAIDLCDAPSWLTWSVEDRNNQGFALRLKIADAPLEPLAQFNVSVGVGPEPKTSVPLRINVLARES